MTHGQLGGLLGRLAVSYRLITMDQLEAATAEQGRFPNKKLGEILVALGYLTQVEVDELLKIQSQQVREELKAVGATRPAPVAAKTTLEPAEDDLLSIEGDADGAEAPLGSEEASGGPTGERAIPSSASATESQREPVTAIKPEATEPNPRLLAPLHKLLAAAAKRQASDLLIHSSAPVQMRRFTRLSNLTKRATSAADAEKILVNILSGFRHHQLEEFGEVDFAYSAEGVGRFRANIFRDHRGVNGVFHFVPPHPPSLAELSLPSTLAKLTNFHQGLILITGPAGCGKSATLAAFVNLINEERCEHILTIEDPIECLHPSKRCLVNQREVHTTTGSFERALRAALREDPDVISIGELRDRETISLALSAAETGHLVLGTLHTGSAIRTIDRLVGSYPAGQQPQVRAMLSDSLRAVVSQRLIPSVNGEAVIPALEILPVNKAVGSLIRANKTFQIHSLMQTGRSRGMNLLDQDLQELVKEGRISAKAAAANSDNPQLFLEKGV